MVKGSIVIYTLIRNAILRLYELLYQGIVPPVETLFL